VLSFSICAVVLILLMPILEYIWARLRARLVRT
jgi:hypothetical protein